MIEGCSQSHVVGALLVLELPTAECRTSILRILTSGHLHTIKNY